MVASIIIGYLPLDSTLLRPELLQEDRLSRYRQRLMGGESFLVGQGGREEGWWAAKDAILWGGSWSVCWVESRQKRHKMFRSIC